jgi:hypothetical protein
MSIKLTTENFIEKAKQIHGDLYDYLISEYKSGKDKIKRVRSEHRPKRETTNWKKAWSNHLDDYDEKDEFYGKR